MKILYVSDLDGTLLQSNERISAESCRIINSLVEHGMTFSYATARSLSTAKKVTDGLNAKIPVITHNGTFIVDNQTGERLLENTFSAEEAGKIYKILQSNDIYPIVYSLIGGQEKFSYDSFHINKGTRNFVESRQGDSRNHPLEEGESMLAGKVFYFTCIGTEETLFPLYEQLKVEHNCVYQRDIYSADQWLEIMPSQATKANAARQLKELNQCDKIIAFGDGKNDIPMFQMADECYAVENAVEELKEMATGIIGSNEENGVAQFLRWHYLG